MTARSFWSDLLKYTDRNGQDIIRKYEKGLLTNGEAEKILIDRYKSHIDGTDKSIKDWYTKVYYTDEQGQYIDEHITFEELYTTMRNGGDFYDVIGEADSVIKERIFEELSVLYKTSYDNIYNMWLETA